jgi:uncharacterized protein (TIGR03437 family)
MGNAATVRRVGAICVAAAALLASPVSGQAPADWYHAGNHLLDLSLADLATGPVDRVWYSGDGGTLYALTSTGKVFETSDFETWRGSAAVAPAAVDAMAGRSPAPEASAHLRAVASQPSALYAFARFVYYSNDGGVNWENLTAFRTQSLIGEGLRDLAVSPRDGEDITVASGAGVFRSVDGGKSWSGLNQGLPNLTGARIRAVPSDERGVQLELPGATMVEWQPGEKIAWRLTDNSAAMTDARLRQATTDGGGPRVTAVRSAGTITYIGRQDGTMRVNSGQVDNPWAVNQGGPVERFWVDATDSRVALAVLGRSQAAASGVQPEHVLRTVNGGGYWEPITWNLPDVAVHGVTASQSGGAIYLATDAGVFYGHTDPGSSGAPVSWQRVSGLPAAPVTDVMLDAAGNQLWVAVEGYGVYATIAPHRITSPTVASSADLTSRAAAPGALLSVIGAGIVSATAGDQTAPVLNTSATKSEIQIPFTAQGDTLALSLSPATGIRVTTTLPLVTAAPGIIVNTDGAPLVLDAETNMMLDASHPAHAASRIQVLATGLGRVNPDWPAGVPAPMSDTPPSVIAKVSAFLDRAPVTVTRAVLAPGLTGFYLVELELPKIVNYGPVELHLEAGGHTSNRVRVYIER